MKQRLIGAGIGLAVCAGSIPVAVILTIVTFPFWRWFESKTGLESFGHSGHSEWCYLVVYGVVVICASVVWGHLRGDAE